MRGRHSPQGRRPRFRLSSSGHFQFETRSVSNHTACRFAEKARFFRSLWAGRRCAAASRFIFFKVETLPILPFLLPAKRVGIRMRPGNVGREQRQAAPRGCCIRSERFQGERARRKAGAFCFVYVQKGGAFFLRHRGTVEDGKRRSSRAVCVPEEKFQEGRGGSLRGERENPFSKGFPSPPQEDFPRACGGAVAASFLFLPRAFPERRPDWQVLLWPWWIPAWPEPFCRRWC